MTRKELEAEIKHLWREQEEYAKELNMVRAVPKEESVDTLSSLLGMIFGEVVVAQDHAEKSGRDRTPGQSWVGMVGGWDLHIVVAKRGVKVFADEPQG